MAELQIYYERINRLWINPVNRQRLADGITSRGYDWDHGEFKWFKDILKERLRERQKDRCCYCRRLLRHDKGVVEIEHIVDKGSKKGQYKRFSFEIKNLALSCKDCNNAKGVKDVLAIPLNPGTPYSTRAADYIWVHPHFHNYSDHITIHEAWIYEARGGSKEGLAVIEKCFLNKLATKERKNRKLIVSSATDLRDAIRLALGVVSDVGLDALCREFGTTLARKWSSTPEKVEQAIRESHLALQNVHV
jgi:hypothetical protein